MKKVITLYTQYYKPVANACSNRAENLILALKDEYEVHVVTGMPNYPSGVKDKKYRWRLFKKEVGTHGEKIFRTYELASKNERAFMRILNYVSFLISSFIFGICTKKPYRIIVTSPPLFTAISVLWIHKIKKIPYIVDVRDLWPESVVALGYMKKDSLSYQVFHYFELKIYKNAKSIIGVTKGITNHINELGFSGDKVFLQYNISEKIKPGNINPFNQYKNIIKGRKIALFAGNMNEAYDFDRVYMEIRNKNEIFFVFIGDGIEKKRFKTKVLTLDNVLFLDRMSKSDLDDYIYNCDIILVPLKDELFYRGTFPVKGIEGIVNHKEILFFGPQDGEFKEFLNTMELLEEGINTEIFEFSGFKKNINNLIQ